MGLFNRKPTVRLGVFCADFYDNQILDPVIKGVNLGRGFCDVVVRNVAEVDKAMAAVDRDRLFSEMTLGRFEVFGLAWLHQFGDKHAAAQSEFTRLYLERRGRGDIWRNLEPYNQCIARSSIAGHSSEKATGRAYLAFVNRMRADLFDLWAAQGFDDEAVARAANRISTDAAWKQGITAGFLMLTLCERLGCTLNEQGQFRLMAVIRGLYDGARDTMKKVNVEA